MSAPGADPLAAIRQRFVSRSQVRRLIMLDAGSVHDDICAILKQWDTRQSALRALVAQWREEIGGDPLDRFDDGWVAARRGCIDGLERLLSGPQP